MKSFYFFALSLYFVPWSCVSSQNLTKDYTSYRVYPWCTPSEYMRYPKTAQDVVDIVQEAISKKLTVKAFGSRHSQTDIICTEGIPVDMRGVQSFRMNPDGITATIGAGVNVREASTFLRQNGRALRNIPGYGNITLGGAIGTGAHGSTIKYNASISSQVVGLTVVDGLGQLRNISDPDDLKAFRLSLGLLGIILDVTLYTVPLYKTKAYNYAVSDESLTNGDVLKWARNTDQISIYWFPSFGQVVVANWTIVDVNTPGDAFTYDHTPSMGDLTSQLTAQVREIASDLTSTPCALASTTGYTILHVLELYLKSALLVDTPGYVPIYTEDGVKVKNPAVGYYDLMFAPICSDTPQGPLNLACVWDHGNVDGNITVLDSEFGLALDDLPKFINVVKDIISKTPTVFPLQGILMRFSDSSDIYLSTAFGRQTVHFEFYLWKRTDPYKDPSASLAGYQTILQTLTQEFKGRAHWGKSGLVYHDLAHLGLRLDPVARQNFVAAMNKFDPNGVFMNSFGSRMKNTGDKVDTDPLTIHCALLDNCICSKNSDCGDTQTCTSASGYNYKVCKTRNEIPERSLNISGLPLLSDVVNWLTTVVPTLASAALSTCSLGGLVGGVVDVVDGVVDGPILGKILGPMIG